MLGAILSNVSHRDILSKALVSPSRLNKEWTFLSQHFCTKENIVNVEPFLHSDGLNVSYLFSLVRKEFNAYKKLHAYGFIVNTELIMENIGDCITDGNGKVPYALRLVVYALKCFLCEKYVPPVVPYILEVVAGSSNRDMVSASSLSVLSISDKAFEVAIVDKHHNSDGVTTIGEYAFSMYILKYNNSRHCHHYRRPRVFHV